MQNGTQIETSLFFLMVWRNAYRRFPRRRYVYPYRRPFRRTRFRVARRSRRMGYRRPYKRRTTRRLFKRYRRSGKIITEKNKQNTRGILRWIKDNKTFFDSITADNAREPEANTAPSQDALYTAIRYLTKTCWAAARYIYKYRRRFRVFPKLYEMNKNNNTILNSINNIPPSLAIAKEFYELLRLMKKQNPRSEDWKTIMTLHQTVGSFAVAVTASAIKTPKLENLIETLFSDKPLKTLGLIVASQLIMLRIMITAYNIVPLQSTYQRIMKCYQ